MPDGVPNYLSTDAAGLVSATFPGGIRVQADLLGPPQNPAHSVTWLSGPNGAAVASIGTTYNPTFPESSTTTYVADTIQGARAGIQAQAFTTGLDPNTYVDAVVNNPAVQSVRLIDGANHSSFVRLGGFLSNARVLAGWVAANGAIVSPPTTGPGFGVVHTGTGVYDIQFPQKGVAAIPLASPIVGSGHVLTEQWIALSGTNATVAWADTGTGVAFDTQFGFLLIFMD